jgi:TonB-linked SusC/RagA family outer membrane protein
MEKRLFTLIACLFLSIGMALAQTQVTGTVVSSEDGQPVIGASIKVIGTNTGTITDSEGNFRLNLNRGAQLEISYIGMVTKRVRVNGNTIRVTLDPDNQSLDEVMVVAFGTQKKSSFTGSAAVVDSKDLKQKITTSVADALVGSVPGLQVVGSSGQPGSDNGAIHIRGIASMYASTSPLIVVDGAPYSASLSNIPQDDIESVTVLKDAASAALYGARGAAGVILITTKKGNTSKAKINLEAKWGGTSRSVQDYETIDDPGQYLEAYYSQFYNYARYGRGLSQSAANAYANSVMIDGSTQGLGYNPYSVPDGENLIGLDGKLNPNATLGNVITADDGTQYYIIPDDWKDAAYKNGNRQEYNINISGGNTRGSYYTSAGYLKEDGVIDHSGYERFTSRLKADYQATKWLKVFTNMSYVHSKMLSNPNLGTSGNSTNLAYYAQYIAPIYPLYVRILDENGNPVIKTDEYGHKQYDYGVANTNYPGITRRFLSTGNPIGANEYNDSRTKVNQFQGQYNFDIQFTSWLKFSSINTLNYQTTWYSYYGNPYVGPSASENGNITKESYNTFRQNYQQLLNFNKSFGKHDIQAMIGHEWYKTHTDYMDAEARGGFSPDIQEINAFADRYDSHSYNTTYNVEGFFGNVLYNYDEKYFGQASYRRDGSSRFAKEGGHRWGDFWSVGGAWIISKENFFKELNADWVDNLKLKISIGQQGNDNIGNFQYTNLYTLTKGDMIMNPSFASIGNPDITWETTTNFNVGLEFGLFTNRLTGEFNYYNKKTTDLLFWLSVPESYGARGYYGNLGDIRNQGIELTLTAVPVRTRNIEWTVTGNISHNTTKILKLPEDKISVNGGFTDNINNIRMWFREDGPLYNGFMKEYAGVNEQGLPLYWVDDEVGNDQAKCATNHDRTTTNWNEASYYEQGSMLPKVSGGFSTTLTAYSFDVSLNFDFQLGGKVYDTAYQSLMGNVASTANGYALHEDVLKSWTPNNTSSDIPRFQYQDQYTTSTSTRFLTSARYLNFQSFAVGYTLPASFTRKFYVDRLRIYIQGENLCFWSARKGLDPRYSYAGTDIYGVEAYKPVRTIMGGIQVSF